MSELAPLDPERLFRTLADHRVRYVLIGAMAARLHGFPRMTADADITPAPDRENLQNLATALRALDAKVFTESVPEGLPFDTTAEMLGLAQIWNLATAAGRLDIVFRPSGTTGHDDLAEQSVAFRVFGVDIRVASLSDIIRSKESADRPQDRQDVVVLREILRRQAKGG